MITLTTYLRAGIALLPLHHLTDGVCSCTYGPDCERGQGKHPRTRNGMDDATLDRAQVTAWARRWPRCNWGGRPPVGQFVLDIDPRHGGLDSLGALELEHGVLPRTRTARTGGGGMHLWFQLPEGHQRPLRGQLGGRDSGLDVKTNRGYLVLPPSITSAPYEWLEVGHVAPAPAWMIEQLTVPISNAIGIGGGIAGLVRTVALAEEGNRNGALYWAAVRCVESGTDPDVLVPAAQRAGLPTREIDRTIQSARRAQIGA